MLEDSKSTMTVDFRSDNVSGAHPAVLQALLDASRNSVGAYGDDPHTQQLQHTFSELFEREVAVFPVATGTAANALSIALYSPPWGAVYCHPHAHIQVSECGAPEAFSAGAKLVSVAASEAPRDGKLTAQQVEKAIHREGAVHAVQPAVISVSQATEIGTLYRPDELGSLSALAKHHGMALHVDGARFANALVALQATPAQLTWQAGVDVLSFGATKNGCLTAEAVVLFDLSRAQELAFRRKRAGHLLSKMRFVSAQLAAYVRDGLWLQNARWANQQATKLAEGLTALGLTLCAPVETNQVFVELSDSLAARLRQQGFLFYDWTTLGAQCRRLVTAFDTSEESVRLLLNALADAQRST